MTKFKQLHSRQIAEQARKTLAREKRRREQTLVVPFIAPTRADGSVNWEAFLNSGRLALDADAPTDSTSRPRTSQAISLVAGVSRSTHVVLNVPMHIVERIQWRAVPGYEKSRVEVWLADRPEWRVFARDYGHHRGFRFDVVGPQPTDSTSVRGPMEQRRADAIHFAATLLALATGEAGLGQTDEAASDAIGEAR
jgi:hypothetical protein